MATVEELISKLENGKNNAKHALKLEKELSLDIGNTQETTRNLIRNAIVNHNIPIGSSQAGYFLVDTEAELDNVVQSLQKRIKGLQDRIDGIQNGWEKRKSSREQGKNWPK